MIMHTRAYNNDSLGNTIIRLIQPFADWKNEKGIAVNQQAKEVLKKVLNLCENIPADYDFDSEYYYESCRNRWWIPFYEIEKALSQEFYMVACHELIDIIGLWPFRQGRILYNIVYLLKKHLWPYKDSVISPTFYPKLKRKPKMIDRKQIFTTGDFDDDMITLKCRLEEETSYDKQMSCLESFIRYIKIDLQCDILTKLLYAHRHFSEKDAFNLFPSSYTNEHGLTDKVDIQPDYPGLLNFANEEQNCTIVLPFYSHTAPFFNRLGKSRGKKDCIVKAAAYYESLGILFVFVPPDEMKYKSLTMNSLSYDGVPATHFDIEPLFEHVYTDGKAWYSIHTKDRIADLYDYRIGLLFEATKMFNELKKNRPMGNHKDDIRRENCRYISKSEMIISILEYEVMQTELENLRCKCKELENSLDDAIGKCDIRQLMDISADGSQCK